MVGAESMRTIFAHNWVSASRHWMGGYNALGQAEETMAPPDRENMLAGINAAMEKVPELEDLIAYSGDNDPNLSRTLGMDASRFFALSNSIAPLYQTVKAMQDRLYEPEPAMWTMPTAAEFAAVKQWVTGITEMYKIYLSHKNLPLSLPLDTEAPPGFTNTKTPTTPEVITRPAATPAAESPFSTKNVLIGGGVMAAVGILVYALVS